jgi:hypothetical protein
VDLASWFKDGLRFECTQCGNCCSGTPGTVRVSDDEIEALAGHLEVEDHQFRDIYTRALRKGEISLREKSNRECIFFKRDRGCTVYAHRPRQCRSWPFWRSVIDSKERWGEEAEHCPGMNRGELHSAHSIHQSAQADGTLGIIPSKG